MTERSTVDDVRGSSPDLVGVALDARTYRNLAYLLVRFPLGVAYFSVFLTGIALGVGLLPVGVGVVVLPAVLGAAEYAALVEARLLGALLGREVTVTPTDPASLPLWTYLKTVGTRGRNYLLVGYFLASLFVGTAAFVAVTVGVTLSVALLLSPLVFWLPWTNYAVGSLDVGGVHLSAVDTLPEAVVASIIGAVFGLVCLHLFNATARALGSVTAKVIAE